MSACVHVSFCMFVNVLVNVCTHVCSYSQLHFLRLRRLTVLTDSEAGNKEGKSEDLRERDRERRGAISVDGGEEKKLFTFCKKGKSLPRQFLSQI